MSGRPGERGQALILLVGALGAILIGAVILGAVARGIGAVSDRQRAADLGALAGARSMRSDYGRLFEPRRIGRRWNPRHLTKAAFLARARAAAMLVARRNGARRLLVAFPDGRTFAPVRIRVGVHDAVEVGKQRRVKAVRRAEAELVPPGGVGDLDAGPGDYRGPLASRQGKRMRPDVARWFDKMAAAARRAGVGLIINSAYRSSAEQARLFAQHPDPKWVAPPGTSLHRYGTELDLGPPAAYGGLAANAKRFGFIKRYAWEPWHFGFGANPRDVPA